MADGVGQGIAVGGFKGGQIGAKLGSFLPIPAGGLIGTAAGAAIGGTIGGLQAKKTAREREKALQLPSTEDPGQTARLLEVDRIAKNIQAGADTATQTQLGQIAESTAATQSRLGRATGGNVGATTDAMLKAQRVGGQQSNQAIAQGQSRLPFFMNLGQQIANRAEQRKLELELLDRAQTSAETAQDQKEGNVNANALMASGLLGSNLENYKGRIQGMLDNVFNKDQGEEEGGVGGFSQNEMDIMGLENGGLVPEAALGSFGQVGFGG